MFLNGLLLAVIAIVGVGFLDDRFTLRGRQKLAGQVAAAGILIASGLRVEQIHVFGTQIDLGLLGIPFTLFWLLGAINSLNLIDGIDGLASSVGVILSMSIAGMAWMTGHDTEAIIALALCGALLGFLVYNFPPASIYLGDAGSMLIGLLLGALAIRSSLKGPATVALAAPTVMWTIPILDVGMAILRRKLTGRSIYHTDRGHLHHCLLRQGFSNRTTLFWIGLLCVFTAFGSLASVASQNEWLAISSAVMVFAVLLITRWFGNVEVALLGCRIRSLVLSVFHVPQAGSAAFRVPVHTRFTGTRDWEDLWNTLTEYAERFDLCSVQLNVQLPAWNEDYHVNWVRRDQVDDQHEWSTELPLISNDLTVGRLQIRGRCNHGSVCTWMGELIAGLKPFEAHLLSLLEDQLVQAPQEQFEDSIREPVPA
ncbi:MAG: undecaprenyl/decaprenyl-phosphate alpha-N-acetylglucosaminyl 1-phosphate transferase [Planctomycetes bacterium]|nr:undecaprenyl/decaprenyl-phosphate alpha-N-acetylglucosaminyl 1-phosphate transferase [Planctomycetota bacterium]